MVVATKIFGFNRKSGNSERGITVIQFATVMFRSETGTTVRIAIRL